MQNSSSFIVARILFTDRDMIKLGDQLGKPVKLEIFLHRPWFLGRYNSTTAAVEMEPAKAVSKAT